MAEVAATNSSKDKVEGRPERGPRERNSQPFEAGPDEQLLSLQRTIGNRSVGHLLQSVSSRVPHTVDKAAPVVREVLRSSGHQLSNDSAPLRQRLSQMLGDGFSGADQNR